MEMITRRNAYDSLIKKVGCELSTLAKMYNIPIFAKNGNINKGWKGHTLEKAIGLSPNNKKAPNGLGFELKTVPCYFRKDKVLVPKETIAITMINPSDLEKDDFFDSHLWDKIKSLIICYLSWDGKNSTSSTFLGMSCFDCLTDYEIIHAMRNDYNLIRNKLKTQGFHALTGKDGQFIQTRPKGGKGSKTRAFYARKDFLKRICPIFSSSHEATSLKQSYFTSPYDNKYQPTICSI